MKININMNSTAPIALPKSVAEILALYQSLPSPISVPSTGKYIGQSIAPVWLVAMGWPLLKLGALAGWKGKHFYADGHVMNIVERNGVTSEVLPIFASIAPYTKANGNMLRLAYASNSPFPWGRVTDELRLLPDGRYLGITTVDLPLLNRLPYPFVLTPVE